MIQETDSAMGNFFFIEVSKWVFHGRGPHKFMNVGYQQGKATFDAQSRAFHSFVSGFYMAFMAAFWCPTFKNLFSDAIPWFNGMVLKLEMSTGNQFRY